MMATKKDETHSSNLIMQCFLLLGKC